MHLYMAFCVVLLVPARYAAMLTQAMSLSAAGNNGLAEAVQRWWLHGAVLCKALPLSHSLPSSLPAVCILQTLKRQLSELIAD